MESRKALTTGAIGDYSELLVAATYISAGYEVAFPFGNHSRWDMLVRRSPGPWLSVQVKTVAETQVPTPTIHATTTISNAQVPYSAADVDLIVAVHPETGTIWRIPPEVFDGKARVQLLDDYIWRGTIDRAYKAERKARAVADVDRQQRRLTRRCYSDGLPAARPKWMKQDTWDMVLRWVDGYGFKTIAKSCGISPSAVRVRIFTTLNRLGLKGLPASMQQEYHGVVKGHRRCERPSSTAPQTSFFFV